MSPSTSPQAAFAREVVERLRAADHEALWAGGCVRDALLGKPPKDYDVATDATPDRVREVFGKRRTIAVGESFGVITVLGPKEAGQIEIATFRTDGGYSDGRRPDTVVYASAEEDAQRRDFTINGLFFDPIDERIIDYVGGQADLKAGVVRAIGKADERFAEDRLRMLRAVRFAASLGFEIDHATLTAVQAHADAIAQVSPERIGAELKRMLTESDPPRAMTLLHETGLWPHLLPPLSDADRLTAIERLGRLDNPSASLALAAALADAVAVSDTPAIGRSLRWTNKEIELAGWLLQHRHDLGDAESRPWSEVQPLLAAPGGADLLALRRAERGEDATHCFCQERLGWPAEKLDPPPLLAGADLIATGLRPGPEFAKRLAQARAAQLDGSVQDKPGALRLLGLLGE